MDGVGKAVSPRYGVLHLTFLRFAVTAAMGGLLFLVLRAAARPRRHHLGQTLDPVPLNCLAALAMTLQS